MYSEELTKIEEIIKQTSIQTYPYTYIEIDKLFPDNLYNLLLKNRIDNQYLYSLKDVGRVGKGYSDSRLVLDLKPNIKDLPDHLKEFWEDLAIWFHYSFKKILFDKFNINNKNVKVDVLYTRDSKNYSLGPHTDSTKKILTGLFYIPKNDNHTNIGTSIYTPKDKNFRCPGGYHHKSNHFDLYKTISYTPNKFFCFLKSDKSFHGVEPVTVEVERDLIIYDIQQS